MNPHFLFNALNSIQALITRKDAREANRYISRFSHLVRMILEMSRKNYIRLSQEVEFLQLYLELERTRFDGDFSYQVRLCSTLQDIDVRIPSMMIQPFVENAIKHGLRHKLGPKWLEVRISLEGNRICCCVEDNGIGRNSSKRYSQSANAYPSRGISLTERRISLLNSLHEMDVNLEIKDLVSAQGRPAGTRVNFSIPFKND